MNEEKLYAVKNDEGEYWDFCDLGSFWKLSKVSCSISEDIAKHTVKEHGGNVVTFVEEPEKVVLTKEQAKIVEGARDKEYPATYISKKSVSETSGEEEFLMNAYVNGYTVAKEKKYLVELDGLVTTDGAHQCLTKKDGKWFACRKMLGMHQDFTDEELNNAPEWAQQLDREEVTDDER